MRWFWRRGAKPRANRRRSWGRNALLGACVTLVFFLALEGVCRLLLPTRTWDPTPKPPGVTRIFVFGGSTVFGFPFRELSFVPQFRLGLRRLEPSRRFEVFNGGLSARDSTVVRECVEHAVHDHADLIIVFSAHNEFGDPEADNPSLLNSVRRAIRPLAITRLFAPLVRQMRGRPPIPQRVTPYRRDTRVYRNTFTKFSANVEAMVRAAQRQRVALMLCTCPSNIADWPPVHQRIAWALAIPEYDAHVQRIQGLLAQGKAGQAEEAADRLLRHHDDAMLLYLKGQCCRAQGRIREAKALLTRAKDLDPVPCRAHSRMNAVIRSYRGEPGVSVVDLEEAFAQRSRDGLIGSDLIADNCHPTPLGHAIIARALVAQMAEQRLFVRDDIALQTPKAWLEEYLAEKDNAAYRHLWRLQWLVAMSQVVMAPPFFDYEKARNYLDEALERAPHSWAVRAHLGIAMLLDGDADAAHEQLQVARRLRGRKLTEDERDRFRFLDEAIRRAGGPLAICE